MAGILKEIWTGEMIKAFREPKENKGWYDRIRSFDQYVDNDVIHFTELGGDPDVLVNNTTYPLDIQTLADTDKPVSLDKFDTTATPVTDDELHATSYDKMGSVLERHREALEAKVLEKAIHAIAPDGNTAEAPVLKAESSMFQPQDILALKRQFDAWKVPREGRILVLCSDHVNDLLSSNAAAQFKEQYNINQTEGRVARLYGFDIYEYGSTPYYTKTALKEVDLTTEINADTHRQASVAFYAGRMMKANGSVQFYASEADKDPLYHRNLVNFRKWGICLPLTSANCRMAIICND